MSDDRSRLLGARYSVWAGDPAGNTWLSPDRAGVVTTAQAIAELDALLEQPESERPISLRGRA